MRIHHSVPLLVLLAAAGIGCSDDGPTAPPVPGSVGGVVTSTWNNAPLAHVLVIVEEKISWTDWDGRYLIEGVTPGNHELIASKWSHQDWAYTVSVTAGQLTTLNMVLTFPDPANADWRDERFAETVLEQQMSGDRRGP